MKRPAMLFWPLAAALLGFLCYGYYRANDGFLPSHILSHTVASITGLPSLSDGEKGHIADIMNQPFYYLGKGCQSYAFVSRDGKYVVKLPKYQRYRNRFWLALLPFLPTINSYAHIEQERKEKKRQETFDSYALAYQQLRDEAALEYVHLDKREVPFPPLILYDRLGHRYSFAGGEVEFLLQRRCIALSEALDALMIQKREEEGKELLSQLVALLLSEYRRGIVDKDLLLMQNTGVYEGNPVHIDIGRFAYDPSFRQPAIYGPHLIKRCEQLHTWLMLFHPSLADHLAQQLSLTPLTQNLRKVSN